MEPDLLFLALLAPFVDTLTTMLNSRLPLTPAEWELWGNPIKSKEYLNIFNLTLLIIILEKKISNNVNHYFSF